MKTKLGLFVAFAVFVGAHTIVFAAPPTVEQRLGAIAKQHGGNAKLTLTVDNNGITHAYVTTSTMHGSTGSYDAVGIDEALNRAARSK